MISALELRRDVAAARPHAQAAALHLNPDTVPVSIPASGARVPEVVLLAQLVRDSRGRLIEAGEPPDDLGASAAVVRDLAECVRVHPFTSRGRPATPAPDDLRKARYGYSARPAPGNGRGDRNRGCADFCTSC